MSASADEMLGEMQKETNDGFESGKVSKTELLSWIVQHFRKSAFQKSKDQFRNDHFDEVAHLRSVIREIEAAKKQSREVDLSQLLAPVSLRQKGRVVKHHG